MTAKRRLAVEAGVGPGNGLDPLEREIEATRGFERDLASAEPVARSLWPAGIIPT